VPIEILIAPFVPVVAPPEVAPIVAVPLAVPGKNRAVARPLVSVVAVTGEMVPSVVTNVTVVPLWGGEPDASITCATMSTDWLAVTTFDDAVSVIVDPTGARSGTFSQAVTTSASRARPATESRRQRATMKTAISLLPCSYAVNTGTRWRRCWSA
jgi:hypothetical protein